MIPDSGAWMIIDSSCSWMMSICSCELLALILRLGELSLKLILLVVPEGLVDLDRQVADLRLRRLHLGDQPLQLLLQLGALELGDHVAFLDELAVVDRQVDDDRRRPGHRCSAASRAATGPVPRS